MKMAKFVNYTSENSANHNPCSSKVDTRPTLKHVFQKLAG